MNQVIQSFSFLNIHSFWDIVTSVKNNNIPALSAFWITKSLFLTKLFNALTSSLERFLSDILDIKWWISAISKSTFDTFFIKITNIQVGNFSK